MKDSLRENYITRPEGAETDKRGVHMEMVRKKVLLIGVDEESDVLIASEPGKESDISEERYYRPLVDMYMMGLRKIEEAKYEEIYMASRDNDKQS